MDALLLYKCPGSFNSYGILHEYKSVNTEEDLDIWMSKGWHKSLGDAAKAFGKGCLYEKKSKLRAYKVQKNAGLPLTIPKAIIAETNIIAENDNIIAENDDIIAENDDIIAEKTDIIAEKTDIIAENDEVVLKESNKSKKKKKNR